VKRLLLSLMIVMMLFVEGCNATSRDYTLYLSALTKAQCKVILSVDTNNDSLFITPLDVPNNYLLVEMSDRDKRLSRLDHYLDAGDWKHYLSKTDEPYFICTEFAKSDIVEVEHQLVYNDVSGDGSNFWIGYTLENNSDDFILVEITYKSKKFHDIVAPYKTMNNPSVAPGFAGHAQLITYKLTKTNNNTLE
jgi:hypothetical protein